MYNHDPRIFRTRSAGLTTLILTLESIKPSREFEISKRINELRVLVFVYLSLPAFLVKSLNLLCIDQLESRSFLTSVTLFITRLRKMSKSDCGRVGTGSFGGGWGAGYFSVAWRFRSNDNDNNIYFIRVSISQKEMEIKYWVLTGNINQTSKHHTRSKCKRTLWLRVSHMGSKNILNYYRFWCVGKREVIKQK